MGQGVPPMPPLSEEEEFLAEIPMPSAPPAGDPDGAGRVLGRNRTAAQVPGHLAPYEQTIVIGGDPKREAPPPAPLAPSFDGGGVDMEQTSVAPSAPMAPPAPAIDQEILAKAQAEAQQIMQHAQLQAQQMQADANAQLQAAYDEAGQKGFEQGMQQGLQQGMAAGQEQGMQETVQRTEQLKMEFVELVMARRKVLASLEPEIIHLAVDIAEKIVGMELSTGREIISGIVRQALSTLKERETIAIRVNPSEVEAITNNQKSYEAMIEGLRRFEVLADGAIEPGSCAIETNLGNVDARISTQLEAVRAGLDEMAKIRAFEMKDKLETEPVEVPGDPEFHAKILAAEAEAKLAEAAAKAAH